jgi:hypothetical protein
MSEHFSRRMLSDAALSEQLSFFEMIDAVYYLPGELTRSTEDQAAIGALKTYLERRGSDSGHCEGKPPQSITTSLRIIHPDGEQDKPLELSIETHLYRDIASTSEDSDIGGDKAPLPTLRLRHPEWLNRAAFAQLLDECASVLLIPDEQETTNAIDHVAQAVEFLQQILPSYANEMPKQSIRESASSGEHRGPSEYPYVLRVWYRLPSLSTKSKRAELVSYAAEPTRDGRPPLTGFVLAGKPGIICLESSLIPVLSSMSLTPPRAPETTIQAASAQIDTYWKRIKTESWSDIPPAHKKVSERLRETCVLRAFGNASSADGFGIIGRKGMVEITGMLRDQSAQGMRGHRGNRGDLTVLMRWMDGPDGESGLPRRLGGRLEKVLGAEWNASED